MLDVASSCEQPSRRLGELEELLDACRTYPGVSNARRITFEYVMLKGINDSDTDARQLVRALKGIPSKVNLIPFNPWPGSDYECSSARQIASFQTQYPPILTGSKSAAAGVLSMTAFDFGAMKTAADWDDGGEEGLRLTVRSQ